MLVSTVCLQGTGKWGKNAEKERKGSKRGAKISPPRETGVSKGIHGLNQRKEARKEKPSEEIKYSTFQLPRWPEGTGERNEFSTPPWGLSFDSKAEELNTDTEEGGEEKCRTALPTHMEMLGKVSHSLAFPSTFLCMTQTPFFCCQPQVGGRSRVGLQPWF